jgi:hypothetical protein
VAEEDSPSQSSDQSEDAPPEDTFLEAASESGAEEGEKPTDAQESLLATAESSTADHEPGEVGISDVASPEETSAEDATLESSPTKEEPNEEFVDASAASDEAPDDTTKSTEESAPEKALVASAEQTEEKNEPGVVEVAGEPQGEESDAEKKTPAENTA